MNNNQKESNHQGGEKLKNMTLRQLLVNNITTVRKPEWNKHAYLKISGTPDGLLHPWGELHDINDFCQDILIVGETGSDWEQY